MTHGGSRKGSGRKKGSSNKVTVKRILEKTGNEDLRTPLEIMHDVMYQAFADGDYDLALKAAIAAAPYFHLKLSDQSSTDQVQIRFEELTDKQLDDLQKKYGTDTGPGSGQRAESSQDGAGKPD